MNKNVLIGLIVGAVLGVLLTSWNKGLRTNTGMLNDIDRHFIEQMIPHHEDAITMATLAIEKSKKTEVKTLAENIIKDQGKEIIKMNEWYVSWFGSDVPQDNSQMGMRMGMMGNETDVETLERAADFDKEFIEQMIPHHQMAVMMANMLEVGTDRVEMKELASEIIKSQSEEIESMRGWYNNWYK